MVGSGGDPLLTRTTTGYVSGVSIFFVRGLMVLLTWSSASIGCAVCVRMSTRDMQEGRINEEGRK
jgi:hypothetical protein